MNQAQLAAEYAQAWGDHSPDAIVAMHTEDTVFHLHGDLPPATGREAVRDTIASLFAHVPDLRFDARRMYFGDDHMVFEYEMSGTADGKPFVCDGVDVIGLRDGLVARKDTYLDLATYGRQAGALPGSSSTSNA
jgi:steroid delta-isomerase-like uncharacterized protein